MERVLIIYVVNLKISFRVRLERPDLKSPFDPLIRLGEPNDNFFQVIAAKQIYDKVPDMRIGFLYYSRLEDTSFLEKWL